MPQLCISTGVLTANTTCPSTALGANWITRTEGTPAGTATYDVELPANDGTKTYFYKFMDAASNVSAVKSVSIKLDTSKPAGGVFNNAAQAGYKALLTWLGLTDKVGVEKYKILYTERVYVDATTTPPDAPAASDCSAQTPVGTLLKDDLTTLQYTDPGKAADGTTDLTVATYRTYLLCAFDKPAIEGDDSHIATATTSVLLRSEIDAPTFGDMTVATTLDGGKNWTNQLQPQVTLTVTDTNLTGGKLCINSRDSMSNCTWQDITAASGAAGTYEPMKHIGGTGQRKYYAFAKDSLGNTSRAPSPKSVIFYSDRTPPYPGSLKSTTVTSGTTSSVTLTWTAPKDDGIGLPTSNVFTLFYIEGTSTGNDGTVPGCATSTKTKQITLDSSAALTTAVHSGAKPNTYYRYSLCFVDKLGNINRILRTQKTLP